MAACNSVCSGSVGLHRFLGDEDANLGSYKSYLDAVPTHKLYATVCPDIEEKSGLWELMICLDNIEAEKVYEDHEKMRAAIPEFKKNMILRPLVTNALSLPMLIGLAVIVPPFPGLLLGATLLTGNIGLSIMACQPILQNVQREIRSERLMRIALKVALLTYQIRVFEKNDMWRESRNATILKNYFFMTLVENYDLYKDADKKNREIRCLQNQ